MSGAPLDYSWIPIFEGINHSSHIAAALTASRRIRLRDGEMLIEAGRPNHHLYILLSGQMQARLTQDDAQTGMPISPGEAIGELSIIDGHAASAYVYAVGESELLAMHEDDFWRHLAPIPKVMRNLTRLITHRLRLNSERMIHSLEQQLKFDHLKRELAAARDIQMGLLPHHVPLFPRHDQLDIGAYLLPAKEVGGDLYDAFPISEDQVLLAVGDVSGKGMPAALFMMRTLTLLRAQGCTKNALDQLLPTLNQLLGEGNETAMFVTLCAAVLSVRDGRLTLFNGGHPLPLLSRQGAPFEVVRGAQGPLLGVMPQARYQHIDITLAPGDRLVMYSDGVTEAENPAQEMFSLARTQAALNDESPQGNMDNLVARLAGAVAEFSSGSEQSDDITILALRYLGPHPPQRD
jgi:phosphoserine phosphatase RsbU/P